MIGNAARITRDDFVPYRPFRAFALFVLSWLTLCAGGAHAFSVKQEIDLGKETSKEVEKEMPISKNETWQKEINDMGACFVPHVTRKDIPYTFRIIDAKDDLNAFSLPGGYVYFTERMWKILTPDERAAVMAHEIAHCDRRHAVDQMIKSQQRALWTLPIAVLTGGAGMMLVSVANWAAAMRYSRIMEREADELGIKMTQAAGYSPAGLVTSMKKLLHIESTYNHYEISEAWKSHPDTQKRVDYLTQAALSMGVPSDELYLKRVDDPTRLGNVTSNLKDMNVVAARTSVPLRYGDKVIIKKVLWNDEKQALAPTTVATAIVLTPGNFPTLVIETTKEQSILDVMPGDGVFPSPALTSSPTPDGEPSEPDLAVPGTSGENVRMP